MEPNTNSSPIYVSAERGKTVERKLQELLQRIDQKVRLLEQRKAELRAQMKELALQMTQPSEESIFVPHHKYVLQGVSTRPHIMYLRHLNADLVHLGDNDEDQHSDWQWWRISWLPEVEAAPLGIGPQTQAQIAAQDPSKSGANAGEPQSQDFSRQYSMRAQRGRVQVFTRCSWH